MSSKGSKNATSKNLSKQTYKPQNVVGVPIKPTSQTYIENSFPSVLPGIRYVDKTNPPSSC